MVSLVRMRERHISLTPHDSSDLSRGALRQGLLGLGRRQLVRVGQGDGQARWYLEGRRSGCEWCAPIQAVEEATTLIWFPETVVEQHPNLPLVAVSGIDSTVKVGRSPPCPRANSSDHPSPDLLAPIRRAHALMAENRPGRADHPGQCSRGARSHAGRRLALGDAAVLSAHARCAGGGGDRD